MPYALGAVKPHVKAAAESIGPRFGIRVIYGWRAGIKWDHPRGLALDFMTTQKAVGDALASYVVSNAPALGVTYVIWWRRVWTPEKGWHPYTSTPNPHIDHVHVSFSDRAGTGVPTDPMGNNPLVPDQLEMLDDALKWIVKPGSWVRIGMFGVGAMFMLIALFGMTRVMAVARKAIPNG